MAWMDGQFKEAVLDALSQPEHFDDHYLLRWLKGDVSFALSYTEPLAPPFKVTYFPPVIINEKHGSLLGRPVSYSLEKAGRGASK